MNDIKASMQNALAYTENLLNEAYNTIDDLPKQTEEDFAYSIEEMQSASDWAFAWSDAVDEDADSDIQNDARSKVYLEYICRLADEINVLETALNNVKIRLDEMISHMLVNSVVHS